MRLENGLYGLQIEFGRQVHNRQIFFIEILVLLDAVAIALDQIVKQILNQYEDKLAEAPIGKRLDECYNLETLEPTQEYVELYGEVKEKLSKFGLNY